MDYPTGLSIKTCCLMPAHSHICACFITHPDSMRGCLRCPITAPWEHCAHWAIQDPELREALIEKGAA